MNKTTHSFRRNYPRALLLALFLSLGLVIQPFIAPAATLALTPIVSGLFTDGDGVNSHWVQVQNNWQGSSSFSQDFGGISSLQDANVALAMSSSDAGFVRSADAVMSNINAGNDRYNQDRSEERRVGKESRSRRSPYH